ncbi:fumarylacetoacetate hydrolase family protein [Nitratireductor pacificus]|uniref:Fumarylacetoacetate hydrolase family protein n=1 Tax=Nitratireductor pacificus pht-3B TaxID=391937 RepID=K2MLK6_9HYPH|nr:fumarylacetoacetate hydrolase family protein [Nitratireductor pacificus]EKF18102.1 fumarylacetoacetate hydrolase family protein [Nitratireductor pacificus pht-3B]
MKLATLRNGRPDGALVVVSRDLQHYLPADGIAPTMQAALDDWDTVEPRLRDLSEKVETDPSRLPFDPVEAMAPLPRAYQWADGSAYVNHVELVRKARGAGMPETFWTDPLIYQGAADCNLGPREPIRIADEKLGCDFEGEIAVVVGPVPAGADEAAARDSIRLIMLVNDVTLRNLVPGELAKGFGFFQSKPQTAFSPVAVTPDELGEAWDGERVHLPLLIARGDEAFGRPEAGSDMVFSFARLIAHVAQTRPIGAGGVIGSGTISNADPAVGSACIAERRAREMIADGEPKTPFLADGERVRIEMLSADGASIFGAIEQQVRLG